VPVPPEVITSHDALDVAVQPHVVPFVVMATLPLPPVAAKLAVAGESAVTAHAAADCVTECTSPPAVIVALRPTASLFAETEYAIVPLAPVPVPPEVITSHAALDVAVQPQVVPFVVTVTLPLPPVAPKLAVAGVRALTAHAAADCVTVCTCAPAVIVAVREAAFGFDDAEYSTVPVAPVPVPPEVITSHDALDSAVQPHVVPFVVTVTLPLPPDAAKIAVAGESAVTAHAAADCVTACT